MPLEQDPKISIDSFIKRYKKKLPPESLKLLKAINALAAEESVALGAQSDKVIKLVGKQLEKSFDESSLQDAATSIYSLVIEQMDRETDENRRRHRAQGHYDQKYIHERSLRDQLQDHDMSLLMPKPYGNIEVLGPVNRFDSRSVEAAQEGIALALQNKKFKHIFIPIGPGHWRGVYLTKPVDGTGKYQLELFDPYGPGGANAIRGMTLDLLKKCGIKASQITITTTGPINPQQDAYACGDFTSAYSHKKMKELGAPSTAYNQELINVLDTQGNKKDSLRHATRGVSKTLTNSEKIEKESGKTLKQEENVDFTETEKREFLSRLVKKFSDPDQIDKAVLDQHVAKIKTPLGNTSNASLRELDAYGVFNPDGSLNESVAQQFEITFDIGRIKPRLESYGFKHLSFREMIVFESAIGTVINELSSETFKKIMTLQDELDTLLQKNDPKSQNRKEEIEDELEYIKSHQPSKGLARQSLADIWPPTLLRLTTPLSMDLSGPARQRIGMGYFKFKDTNVSISPGPNSAKSLIPAENPELYEAHHDIARYFNNLLKNNVAHVFAMGRVLPYYPQEGFNERAIIKEQIVEEDFINYFIPDANGRVILPDIPELKDVYITSQPIKKVGRFFTYEISINGNDPIQIHHFPIRDKQPLELTTEELAYVKEIGQTTPPEQNIHTHCRGGKGRSAQIAYLLASLNPNYTQLSHKQRLTQMRAEKTDGLKREFIETPLQKGYISETGYLIHEDIGREAPLEDENIELYVIYGTLLKQEIDTLLRQIGIPKRGLIRPKHQALLELMEKYQELSSIPSDQLKKWITEVCENPIVTESTTESTQKLLTSINNSAEFLLHAFKENKHLDELGLFFDLLARNRSYLTLLDQLENIPPEQVQIEEDRFVKYRASFVAHMQDAYLKNSKNLNKTNKLQLKLDVFNNISETMNGILESIFSFPKELTREKFERLKDEYHQCKQRIELLENAERNDNYQVLDAELKQRSKFIEQLFILGYDHFEIDPTEIPIKMALLYQQLSELNATNELSPERWDELKKQFTALKFLFDSTKPDDMEPPVILTTLDTLFQGKREQTIPLFTWRVLQAKPNRESLDEFVARLSFAVLEAAFTELPEKYYGNNADGAYSKEINQLLVAIAELADSYRKPPEKGAFKLKSQKPKLPAPEEYEKARQQVIELISKHVPFLITTNDLRVQLENLNKDFQRLEHHFQLRTPEFKELKKRFIELKEEYQKTNPQLDNPSINQLIEKFETQIKTVVDLDEEKQNLFTLTMKQHLSSMENVSRIQAIKSGVAREVQDDINDVDLRVKAPSPYKQPKLIVFDADALIHLEEETTAEVLNVLKHAKKQGIEVAFITNRTPSEDAEEQTPIARLKSVISSETGINISDMLIFLNTDSLRQEKQARVNYFHEKISKLEQKLKGLKEQLPHALNKEELEKNIRDLQLEVESLQKKAERFTSDKFMQLDAARRHYRAFKNPNNYYQMVEGGVLLDFRNPGLTKNIGIDDFKEKKEIWTDLFDLAEALMRSPALKEKEPKPSLHTILKDLIFDVDKPERLHKKYGNLSQWGETINSVSENKKYFRKHISQIDSFYQSRLAYQKLEYERIAALHEEDVVYLDSQEDIVKQIHQQSHYRTIKMGDLDEDSLQFTVEFNYEIGAYNDVIAYLNEDQPNIPLGYDPRNSHIPNFSTHEFRHTPIVLHVEMSKIIRKLPELSAKVKDQIHFKDQFIEAAIERFKELPKKLQEDFVKSYYYDANLALEEINKQLKDLIASPSEESRQELSKLKAQADKIIAMDAKFSQHISPTFLSSEAKLLKFMIQNFDSLKIEAEKVQLKEKHEETRTRFYIESIIEEPDIYLREIHSALEEADGFDKEFISEQYAFFVSKYLKENLDVYIKQIDPSSQIMEGKYPSLQVLLHMLQSEVSEMDPEETDIPLTKVHRQLIAAKDLCDALVQIAPFQNRAEHLKEQPAEDYIQQVFELSNRIIDYRNKIEESEEYKAKLFLDKAEKYLLAKNWDVGFQWNKHTEHVNGKDKKIPATVAEQLKTIREARKNDNYLEAKKKFLELGQQKELSWRSSKIAKNYYSLFKKEDASLEKDLENEFLPTKKT
ncbi:hypothetical protein [Legionella israelensis]|uniref:Substrate of the Dot/Icm secretion system n=1 Tax=Legionella israelensis TaxID=454 RepID=A0A0W0VMP8_9GAMM|nr:hypothetical protein [Legionella israelensis]KTD21435.1 substrate of the Dot/Icm secretion system [Legionella israelensis]SCY50528.1 hypothetical protein SAMN02746069_02679 [Legionella israelensis DSM 19235]STX58755.1 Dot/Icm secretion system substrate [Legionella israelensis]